MRLAGLGCSLLVAAAQAASEAQPHYHDGKLTPYTIGPPELLLSARDEQRLRTGKPVMQAVVAEDGDSRRMVMVQDIKAPHSVVFGRIMDLERYDQMVSGVDCVANYADYQQDGTQTVKSSYEIHALHMKFKYFVEHTYDPAARCMTFKLDYGKRSDIDDSVGYWYVEPTGRSSCRVFYSCECKLRGWVPGPVYNMLTKEALKKATTWVEREAVKEWRTSRAGVANGQLVRLVSGVRDAVHGLKLPLTPVMPWDPWLAERKRSAVHFVGNFRPAKASSRLG